MAGKNSRGLELTFHKPSKRWCKVIRGKRHYFGKGTGVSDRKSYREALQRYRDLLETQKAESAQAAAYRPTAR